MEQQDIAHVGPAGCRDVTMRMVIACLASMTAFTGALAASVSTLEFDGNTYKRAYESRQQVEPFAEFTRPGETVDAWTELLTLRWHKGSALRPLEAAQRLARRAEASNAGANALISENPAAAEAVVHFLTMAPGSKTVEVDAFKYGPAKDGQGLVAVQFAFRFTIGKTDPADVKKARSRAVEAIRRFDLGQARANFQSP